MSSPEPFLRLLNELSLIPENAKDAKRMEESMALRVLNNLMKTSVLRREQVVSSLKCLNIDESSSAIQIGEQKESESVKSTSADSVQGNKPSNTNNDNQIRKRKDKKKKESKPEIVYRRRHIALQVYYEGAKYSGLAHNLGSENDNSIEKALFAALIKTRLIESRDSSKYSRCGRTDKGVSSGGQVVGLHLKSRIPVDATKDELGKDPISNDDLPKNPIDEISAWVVPKKDGPRTNKKLTELAYAKMLNNVLPDEIRVLGWSPVSTDFSARFSCKTRLYRYFFVRRKRNVEKMSEALQMMVGQHDFRNFCKMDVEKVYNFERNIQKAHIIAPETNKPEDMCYVEILGNAFLWHQIRCIVHVLFLVGEGLESPQVVKELLDVTENPGKPSYPLAPERPLVLHHCGYPSLHFGYNVQNLWMTCCQLRSQWEELVLAAARVRSRIESLSGAIVTKNDTFTFLQNRLIERSKKKSKYGNNKVTPELDELKSDILDHSGCTMNWGKALEWMEKYQLRPEPDNERETVHIPLMERSRGTTYEEKIEALSNSKRRQQNYEENIVKKRKTAEEDSAFYRHMAKQGGAGFEIDG